MGYSFSDTISTISDKFQTKLQTNLKLQHNLFKEGIKTEYQYLSRIYLHHNDEDEKRNGIEKDLIEFLDDNDNYNKSYHKIKRMLSSTCVFIIFVLY